MCQEGLYYLFESEIKRNLLVALNCLESEINTYLNLPLVKLFTMVCYFKSCGKLPTWICDVIHSNFMLQMGTP